MPGIPLISHETGLYKGQMSQRDILDIIRKNPDWQPGDWWPGMGDPFPWRRDELPPPMRGEGLGIGAKPIGSDVADPGTKKSSFKNVWWIWILILIIAWWLWNS